jgi:carbon-monoxide dehydrogenase small subunit
MKIALHVNGRSYSADVAPRRLLLDCLRDDLGLTGTKGGCGIGVCGACTVLVDGRLTSSCLELATRCQDTEIVTIEGVADDHKLHAVQQAFVDHGGFQCGICTPGMVLTTKVLLDETPDPDDDAIADWMMGSLCRCTGYYKIRESIKAAALAIADSSATQRPVPHE